MQEIGNLENALTTAGQVFHDQTFVQLVVFYKLAVLLQCLVQRAHLVVGIHHLVFVSRCDRAELPELQDAFCFVLHRRGVDRRYLHCFASANLTVALLQNFVLLSYKFLHLEELVPGCVHKGATDHPSEDDCSVGFLEPDHVADHSLELGNLEVLIG